eukprot:CAMPEP_0198553628 /NCGR_PEP_ID=MMETSP1462-20131121/80931_1 /TAXON_ID=1333877 /ORGANISM="Brandtodinium nutriculum, Strain RCC3387" /LENGTH=143 /DNA_ID=CAMNT_0044284317 /DNA_START=16 /DNA_END=443 /DNA_ORIENTATION=+
MALTLSLPLPCVVNKSLLQDASARLSAASCGEALRQQPLPHVVDGLLGAVELKNAVARDEEELVIVSEVITPDVRNDAHLLLLRGQVVPGLVMEVAQRSGEVKAPPVDPHARAHGRDEAAGLLDALPLARVGGLVILCELHAL